MAKLALFSASKQQHAYFKNLCEQVNLPLSLTGYKSLWRPAFGVNIPYAALTKQVEVLLKRKRNSAKGKNKSALYWQVACWLNLQKAKWLYRQYQAWLQTLDADYIGVWNGKKFRQAILVIAAKSLNKKIIYFETGPLPGYSAIDPVGVDYFSAIPRNADFYLSRPITGPVPEMLEHFPCPSGLPENYIFIPFQVVEDSNIYLHSPWIRDMRHLFQVIVEASKACPNLEFVIKPHPACPERYDDLVSIDHTKIHFVQDIPSQALVQHAQAVLTVNSTVGMEAIMARKNVIVLGQAIYGFEPLIRLAANQSQLETILSSLDQITLDENLIAHYLDYLANEYAVVGDAMREPNEKHWTDVTQKLAKFFEGKAMKSIGLQETM
ncbi:MAG: hypothetical protein IBX55_14190 [Methyloprofundus sp.]|nr:hypothetical protein [Methyloprofundus sp.]